MSGSLLAPRWLALHAATLSVMVAFGLLGWWQLESYRSSEEQVAQERARAKQTAAAVPLRSLLPLGSRVTDDLAGRAVTVTGRYDAAAQVVVPGRRLDGQTGLGVVTPLRTSDGSVVVVDRGWAA